MEEKIQVKVKPLDARKLKVTVYGDCLLMDKMTDEVKQSITDKQTGKEMSKKEKRNIDKEIKDAIHKTSKGVIGYPSAGFKAGMVESASRVGDKFFSKDLVRGAIKIINQKEGLIPIKFKKQDVLEHTINPNTKYSPAFHDWEAELEILYDAKNISASDIINLINYAGFYRGVGIWSPRCKSSGEYGMYQVKV